jgi:hypothetical protein
MAVFFLAAVGLADAQRGSQQRRFDVVYGQGISG